MHESLSLPPTMARDVLDSIKDGVIALTPKGRILMINPVAESLLGVTARGAVGKTFADTFLSHDGLDTFNDCMLEAIYNPGKPQTIELTLKPGGVEKFVTVRTNLLVSSDDDQIEGVVAVIADISERVLRLRDRLEQEQLRSAAGRFIVAVLAIFSVFTLLLEPIQKFALAGGTDIGPLVGLAALMFTALGIKRWTKLPGKQLGLTWRISRRDLAESIGWSLVFCAVLAVAKWVYLRPIMGISPDERALFEFWVLDNGEVVTSAMLYATGIAFFIVTTPIQEIGTRSAIQAPLQRFLDGVVPSPVWVANLVTTLLFAVLHAHLSPAVAAMVIVPSIFWGWLFQRSGTVVSPTISHMIIGFYATFVLGLFVGFDNR
ncbi:MULTISPECIES: type II CAAX endopeptidase family protein [Thiorhodovibrio]|uniref:type II CAAX endopeptidase family protein n=1 Tax=Thiorhodovibrio TaxID=61593 RepID=UPI0019135B42|nr:MULTISPECIES: type II CAAX endopeptidase family protein [Thiorhodovibrio]MBK5969428.1 hypothetical protein [Thiorhodovibrio winogradskyi]WPL11028.1 sensory histidine kinase AtoS [Thiorhodovibrio litoralis]